MLWFLVFRNKRDLTMTDLLSRPAMGGKTRLRLLMQFAGDWNYELDDVETIIETVAYGDDFAKLFRNVICHDRRKSAWVRHKQAKAILRRKLVNCKQAYDAYLRFADDRDEACLEYLAEVLKRFKAQTRR